MLALIISIIIGLCSGIWVAIISQGAPHTGKMGGFLLSLATAIIALFGAITLGAPWWMIILTPILGALVGTYIIPRLLL